MKAMETDENFPRGGQRPKEGGLKRKLEPSLFGETHRKPKKVRQEKVVKKTVASDELWQQSVKVRGLSYNKLQEGMVILCRVRHLTNIAVHVEFPGLVYGTIPINQITSSFSKRIMRHLKTASQKFYDTALKGIIKVGQLMPAKIVALNKSEKGCDVQATVNPRCINLGMRHDSFKKGAIIWANVLSDQDHGYQLTVGVKDCTVFLPFKNTDEFKRYSEGEPLYCVVHKVVTSTFATTLTVSAKKEHLSNCQAADLSLDVVIPGIKVNFLIEEISSQGIKGEFLDNCFGFINDFELFMANKKKKLKEATTVQASVLYVEPITKVTHLTLLDLQNSPKPQYECGQLMSAKVVLSSGNGLYIQMGENVMGFVTNKRLLKSIPKEARADFAQAVRSKYPVGSQHDCRILDYNLIQQLYICSFEKYILQTKIFSPRDLTLGQAVQVVVAQINSGGLGVKAGNVRGFVPNIHLSNARYTEASKAKYYHGMKLNARVLTLVRGEYESATMFTTKQSLVKSKECLSNMADAVPNTQYVGVVVQTKVSGALITFYGNAKGWISKKTLNFGNSGRFIDPRKYFFIGQAVTVWVLGFKHKKLLLSLNKPREKKEVEEKTGQYVRKTPDVHLEQTDDKVPELHRLELHRPELHRLELQDDEVQDDEVDDEEVETLVSAEQPNVDLISCENLQTETSSTTNNVATEVVKSESILSGAQCFYNMEDDKAKNGDSSEDDEDEPEQNKKRKKLSAAERADNAKKEEERITQIERQLADTTRTPQSAEEFDRLVLAQPNSSKLWLKYIAMHVTATELDKAAAVGKRAIETISPIFIKDKFNIWIALLNLENMYGTKESFEKLFEEAVRYNDFLDIYLSVIEILGKSGKFMEMEEKVKKMRRSKEKQNHKMWTEIGRLYYSLGKKEEARKIKEAALKTVLDFKKQFDIILRFGIMEFQLGDVEHGISTFEMIFDNFPKKVTLYFTYVDLLVKRKCIEQARQVLDRAIRQRFHVKDMKSLMKKFIMFEEQHGTPETVERVKNLAKEYVDSLNTKSFVRSYS